EKIKTSLMNAEEPLSAIDQIMTPHGDIRADASETLYRLFQEKETLEQELHKTLDRFVKDYEMEDYLQDRYITTREGRWVVPIKSGMKSFLPGVVHGSSQTKQTVYMEPEKIIPINNRIRQIEILIEEEIERLLTDLSRYLESLLIDFETTYKSLFECDVIFAKAQFAQQIQGQPIEFSDHRIELNDLRHPLLQLSGKNIIPNTVHLDSKKSILLLSGPNAGGKTILLKSLGLVAHMSRCGLLVSVSEGSSIPFFKDIFVAIGDAQNVDAELSTFAAHLKFLNEASRAKGSDQLILVDEICGSTDPEEGSALARSFIEQFSENQVFSVITSHLGPLKSNWINHPQVLSGSMEYNTKTGLPTYHFIPGVAGDSLAILTALRCGVSEKIILRAKEVLSPESRARLNALEQIENMKHEILELQSHLNSEIHKAESKKIKYEKLFKELESQKNEVLRKTALKAEKKVDEAIAQAKVEQTFKRHESLYQIKTQMPEIIKQSASGSNSLNNSKSQIPSTLQEFTKAYPPGSKIFIPTLNQDGLIQSEPNSKGEVLILSNSIRLQIPWTLLKPPESPQNPTAKLIRKSGSTISIDLQNSEERSLDLRGKSTQDALDELDGAIDRAILGRESRLRIVHGYGTETLKKAVRNYLSRSILVKKWQSAPSDKGGDGATWVELNLE
nr:Smr/MutS family protein [Pseudobdellovibrionaceae bacterium]